jgi:hypothetical protein
MAALPLQRPVAQFHELPLRIIDVPPASLCRISWHYTGEPHFGRKAANRFDDFTPDEAKRYGTCYLGLSLLVAFAESVLHNAVPEKGRFEVPQAAIAERYVLRFSGAPLRLADLTGSALTILGGSGELSGTPDYALPQEWSRAVCAHPANVDGFLYMSRLITNGYAVVLFERDISKPLDLKIASHVRLPMHTDFRNAVDNLNVKTIM